MDLNSVANAFRSARLRYFRADEADAHLRAFVPLIEQDPVIQAMASSAVLRPNGCRDMARYVEQLSRSLLGVAMALLPADMDDGAAPTIVGTMCLGYGGIAADEAHHRTARIGITLAAPYQGLGYGREALGWMLGWAFRHAGLHTVGVTAASFNPRAIRLFEDMGFVREGRRREVVWFDGQWHDEIDFGMTESEWRDGHVSLQGPRIATVLAGTKRDLERRWEDPALN